ncbi:GP46 family protein [Paramagnetospirillum caucaseum]|uniref:GP46 family protein n=1 Tax=Paramagnetospirillum caucaseum TaxID=1244869 RepID=M3AB31_9PROT|nr:phage GP46 family protein [Paramagnetospirillum caucaseum]EME69709.1 GP46 family protein [Paramagnetospirillum caucaseum]
MATDRLITFDPATLSGDLGLGEDGAIVMTDGLETAVTISLFTDRRARDDDAIPDNSGDRRGWCLTHRQQDEDPESDEIGSWLWLLHREKQLASVVARARSYAETALAWMVRRKYARQVTVTAEITAPGLLGLSVEIIRRDGTRWSRIYDYYWTRHAA